MAHGLSRHIAVCGLIGKNTLLHDTRPATRTIRRGFAPASAATGVCLSLLELSERIFKPAQVRLTQRHTALQREEREKGLVISLRATHFVLEFLGPSLTHGELLRNLFPAFFKQPDRGIIRQHVPEKHL